MDRVQKKNCWILIVIPAIVIVASGIIFAITVPQLHTGCEKKICNVIVNACGCSIEYVSGGSCNYAGPECKSGNTTISCYKNVCPITDCVNNTAEFVIELFGMVGGLALLICCCLGVTSYIDYKRYKKHQLVQVV